MRLLYLLDTNILSEPTKKEPNKKIVDKLFEHQFSICTAAQVLYELELGAKRLPVSPKREKLQHFIDTYVVNSLPVLPYGERAAQWQAEQTAILLEKGITPAFMDAQIAAITCANNLTLVTRNVTDFECFEGLRIRNWFK